MRRIGIILAGGSGRRFGGDTPKQYHKIEGQEVISYSIRAMQQANSLDGFFLMLDANEYENKRLEKEFGVSCVQGGASRNESLFLALQHIQTYHPDCESVFINEAARPMITPALIDRYITALSDYDAVITASEITDSLGKYGEHITSRSDYYLIQAPEAFRFPLLNDHFQPTSPLTATVHQLPQGSKLMQYYDFRENFKITYPQDIAVAEVLIRRRKKCETS